MYYGPSFWNIGVEKCNDWINIKLGYRSRAMMPEYSYCTRLACLTKIHIHTQTKKDLQPKCFKSRITCETKTTCCSLTIFIWPSLVANSISVLFTSLCYFFTTGITIVVVVVIVIVIVIIMYLYSYFLALTFFVDLVTYEVSWRSDLRDVTNIQQLRQQNWQSLNLACGTLFRSSCTIQTSPTSDCSDDSWRNVFFGRHGHGALWLLTYGILEKHLLTYLLTYFLTYLLKTSPGLIHLTLKLTELTPGHWFLATPISLALNEHVLCPSHLLRTVCSKPVRWGQVWAAGAAGPPSALIAVRPTTFSAPTLHLSTSVFFAVPRFSTQDDASIISLYLSRNSVGLQHSQTDNAWNYRQTG